MEMCRVLWCLKLPSEDLLGTTSNLYQYNTLYELRITHQTQQRFNDVAMDTAATSFTKHRDDIGPMGQRFLCQLNDGGKTNKNNNRHYTGTLPHRNPLLCAIFARGGLLLHRFCVYTILCMLVISAHKLYNASAFLFVPRFFNCADTVPDWKDPKQMYDMPTVRQATDKKKSASYTSLNATFKRLYAYVNVKCSKVIIMKYPTHTFIIIIIIIIIIALYMIQLCIT